MATILKKAFIVGAGMSVGPIVQIIATPWLARAYSPAEFGALAIFQYQFGAYGTKTATANTNYMIDAFINFGWIGVIFISSFIAVCLIIVKRINNPAAFACMYFFIFQLVGGGFLGTFLGGGLAFFLAIVYFFRPKFSTDNALGIRQ